MIFPWPFHGRVNPVSTETGNAGLEPASKAPFSTRSTFPSWHRPHDWLFRDATDHTINDHDHTPRCRLPDVGKAFRTTATEAVKQQLSEPSDRFPTLAALMLIGVFRSTHCFVTRSYSYQSCYTTQRINKGPNNPSHGSTNLQQLSTCWWPSSCSSSRTRWRHVPCRPPPGPRPSARPVPWLARQGWAGGPCGAWSPWAWQFGPLWGGVGRALSTGSSLCRLWSRLQSSENERNLEYTTLASWINSKSPLPNPYSPSFLGVAVWNCWHQCRSTLHGTVSPKKKTCNLALVYHGRGARTLGELQTNGKAVLPPTPLRSSHHKCRRSTLGRRFRPRWARSSWCRASLWWRRSGDHPSTGQSCQLSWTVARRPPRPLAVRCPRPRDLQQTTWTSGRRTTGTCRHGTRPRSWQSHPRA